MTSRKSFSKLLITCLKNNVWSIAFTCVALFFAMPIYGALYASIMKNHVFSSMYPIEYMPLLFSRDVLGENNILLKVMIIIIAIIIAINGFSYLSSKQKVDLYHSIPIKRDTLFVANYIAGCVTYLIPYVFFMLVNFVLGKSYGVLSSQGIKMACVMLGINLLGFLAVYSVAIIAIMLTGKTVVSVVGMFYLFAFGPIVIEMITMLKSEFFITYNGHEDEGVLYSSIIAWYFRLTEGIDSFHQRYSVDGLRIALYVVAIAVLTFIGYYLYKLRPSEAAGNSMAFTKTMPVISVLILVPMSIYGGVAFESIANISDHSVDYGWLIFGCVITIIIMHFIIQAIYYSDFKSLFKNLINPIVSAGIVLFILLIFILDVPSFDKYFPKEDEFESIAISSYGLSGNQEYYDFTRESDEYGNRNIWVELDNYRYEHMKMTDYALAKDFVTAALSDSQVFDMTKYNEDVYSGTAYTFVNVKYNLKNGKSVYRSYTIDLRAHLDVFDRIYSSNEYKEGVFDILTMDDEEISDIKFSTPLGTIAANLTDAQMKELVHAYQDELLAQTGSELLNSVPVGYIYKDYVLYENGNLYRDNVYADTGYYNNYRLYKGFVYPSFTKTLGLLAEYGIDVNKYSDVSNVEAISVTNFHYDDPQYFGEGDSIEYRDRQQIEELYKIMIPVEMADVNGSLHDESSLDVQVTFKEMPGTYNYSVSYYIPDGKVPGFVEKDVKY